jgi:hypothetical protein
MNKSAVELMVIVGFTLFAWAVMDCPAFVLMASAIYGAILYYLTTIKYIELPD